MSYLHCAQCTSYSSDSYIIHDIWHRFSGSTFLCWTSLLPIPPGRRGNRRCQDSSAHGMLMSVVFRPPLEVLRQQNRCPDVLMSDVLMSWCLKPKNRCSNIVFQCSMSNSYSVIPWHIHHRKNPFVFHSSHPMFTTPTPLASLTRSTTPQ